MIIFGTRTMNSVRHAGTFHCPRCGSAQPYVHNDVKRWFTLYFIPVIPLGTAGSYIECRSCAGTFNEAVLDYNPQSKLREIHLKLRGLLVLVMLANDHGVDADEIRAICDYYHEATDTPLAEEEVRKNVVQALAGHARLCDYARQIAPQLTFQGKGIFLRGACRVLSAKSGIRDDAAAVLTELAEVFQISPQQVQQIVGPT